MGDYALVKRLHMFGLAIAGIAAVAIGESYLGSTRYKLNGATYAVPHKYEFMRNFSLPYPLPVERLPKEPEQSVWLLLPASELSSGVQGYKRWFRGYQSNVEADMVVNVRGGDEAGEFPVDRQRDLANVRAELTSGALRQPDRTIGWDRVYWSVGEKGTPGEGHDLFYLIPHQGIQSLPSNWRVPSCQSSPDINGDERFDCGFAINSGGLTFDFTLRGENLATASRIPGYVSTHMGDWRI